MAKKTSTSATQTLAGFEQSTLRILLAIREQANAAQASANASVRNYLIQLLTGRGLDPQKIGVSPDMTTFVEIVQPAPPAPDAAAAPAGGPAAFTSPATPAAAAAPAQS
jgi:hypothetical protein